MGRQDRSEDTFSARIAHEASSCRARKLVLNLDRLCDWRRLFTASIPGSNPSEPGRVQYGVIWNECSVKRSEFKSLLSVSALCVLGFVIYVTLWMQHRLSLSTLIGSEQVKHLWISGRALFLLFYSTLTLHCLIINCLNSTCCFPHHIISSSHDAFHDFWPWRTQKDTKQGSGLAGSGGESTGGDSRLCRRLVQSVRVVAEVLEAGWWLVKVLVHRKGPVTLDWGAGE